ncbi:hypothetical protein C5167_032322 [Papaver somniferum]|uniref:Exportin-T n=1 Tax=Papaver somniferum TaxID=3469 RepID=A0A4Y7K790_PAPSO|nr:hypothetical protein C5167_032322 [Papaver somniferum]
MGSLLTESPRQSSAVTQLDWKSIDMTNSGSEDGSRMYATGLLVGMEDVLQEKQAEYLSSILIPLCNHVQEQLLNANIQNQEESYAKIANIQQLIMAVNALSKGFSERLVTASRPSWMHIRIDNTINLKTQGIHDRLHPSSMARAVHNRLHKSGWCIGFLGAYNEDISLLGDDNKMITAVACSPELRPGSGHQYFLFKCDKDYYGNNWVNF